MTPNNAEIHFWENVEVERSQSEAIRRSREDGRLTDEVMQRYSAPSGNTAYPLEYAYYLLGNAAGTTVLDYGCGAGENSVLIASHGGEVIGIDISPDLLSLAEKRMELHGITGCEFRTGSAHDLPLADGSVDTVFGMAILHHLDLKLASAEVYRVMKNGGRAIFLEPVRESRVVRSIRGLIPYQSPDVSPFERPLTEADLKEFSRQFSVVNDRAFSLPFVNLIQTLRLPDSLLHFAIAIDGHLLRLMPFLKTYASIRVFELKK